MDFHLISETLADIIDNCEIKPGYRSDHFCIELTITLNNFKIGKGIRKFNNSLLKNQDYLNLINKVIKEEAFKYALPVYNLEYLDENYREVHFTIDSNLFLEVLLLRIYGESIKFSTFIKKKNNSKEMELIKDIEYLEQHNDVTTSHGDLLSDKKAELEHLRENKVKGEQIRSRIQWLSEREKPSKTFCKLETKNFIEKPIRMLQIQNGQYIYDQKELLHQVKIYYTNLFKNQGKYLSAEISDHLKNITLPQITDGDLGHQIQLRE